MPEQLSGARAPLNQEDEIYATYKESKSWSAEICCVLLLSYDQKNSIASVRCIFASSISPAFKAFTASVRCIAPSSVFSGAMVVAKAK